MITGISEHVEMWLEDECDRTELDFILDAQLDEDYGDELLNQSPILPANETEQLTAEEEAYHAEY